MRTIKNNSKTLVALGILIFLTSCLAEEGPIIIENDDQLNVSFSNDIQPIFNNYCIQCHDENHQTGLNLQDGLSYNLLVNVVSTNYSPNLRISPSNLENSVLWHKIIGDDVFGQQMPPIGGPISIFEMEKIETWITQGALNN